MSVAESTSTSLPSVSVDRPTTDPSRIPAPGPSQGNSGLEREEDQDSGSPPDDVDGINVHKVLNAWLCRDCNTKNHHSSKWCFNCWSMGFPPRQNTASRKRRSSTHRRDPHRAAVSSLKCTACKCTPTRGRLLYYTCEDGHVVCQICVSNDGKKKKLCSTCTGVAKRLKKNPFVGRLADRVTQPRDSPSPAATRGKEPKPLPAGLACLTTLLADRDLIKDRDLENARTVKRKLRHLFDDVHPEISAYIDKESLDANAKEFALRKIARDRKIEWNPPDDEDAIALFKRILVDKDHIFQFLRMYEIFLGNCFSQKEKHQKSIVDIVRRQNQDELLAYIQVHCGLTRAEALQVIQNDQRSNISDEIDVVQGQSSDIVRSPQVVVKMILAKVLSVNSTLDYYETLNLAIKTVPHLFRDDESFLVHYVKHGGHQFKCGIPGEYWSTIEKEWNDIKSIVTETCKSGKKGTMAFEVSFRCKDGLNVTKADIVDVTNPRAPKRLTPPDCWLIGDLGSKKRKYQVERFENWSGSTAVKVENITEATLLCITVMEDGELLEVKSFHRVGPLGGLKSENP